MMQYRNTMTGMFGLGIVASFFFAFTFVLNRQMNLAGGSWIWSASLRFLFMLPILGVIVAARREGRAVLRDIARNPLAWFGWSTVGFGVFYTSVCLGSTFGPSWLSAALWQITIVAGALLSPLFHVEVDTPEGKRRVRMRVPRQTLAISVLILAGVVLMQVHEAKAVSAAAVLGSTFFIGLAGFAYPLGNRKMMEQSAGRFNPIQRTFGMTLCSLPWWVAMSALGLGTVGLPSRGQMFQSLVVAVFSGILATVLFFKATDAAHGDARKLAVVESTQAGELIFALAGGVLVFGDRAPTPLGFAGLAIVLAGMVLNSRSIS